MHRDQGLVRGIGPFALAANVVNAVVGAGIFTVPAAVALDAGIYAPAVYLGSALIMAGVTLCFAEAGSRVPTSGGAYGTVEAALGPAAGFATGVLLVVSDVLASGGIGAAVADLVIGVSRPLARALLLVGLYAALAALNLTSVRTTARLISAATVLKLLPLILFVALGIVVIGHPTAHAAQMHVTAASFGRGMILALFAFQGMEAALGASGEVRAPNRTLPRALLLAMLFVFALYLGVQLSAQHLLGAALPTSISPLARAAGQVGPGFRFVMLIGAGVSMLAWMASDVLGSSRMVFAMARDTRLPAWLGRLDRRHVPAPAVLSYVTAGGVLAISGSFVQLVVLSALATVAIYVLVCISALVLRRLGVATAGSPTHLPALPFAAAISLAGMAAIVWAAHWQEIAGLAGLIIASLVAYLVGQRARARSFPG